jgi:hypothetical protein
MVIVVPSTNGQLEILFIEKPQFSEPKTVKCSLDEGLATLVPILNHLKGEAKL